MTKPKDVLLRGEVFTYVGEVETTPTWYTVAYMVRNNAGEYCNTRKFDDSVDAVEWRKEVQKLINNK